MSQNHMEFPFDLRRVKAELNRRKKWIGPIITVVLLAVILAGALYTVDDTEKAVITRFGKFVREAQPGLNVKIPFGVERKTIVKTSLQDLEYGYRTESAGKVSQFSRSSRKDQSIMLTGDLNIVDVTFSVQYQITSPRDWLFNLEEPKQTMMDITQSVVNQLVGDRKGLEVMTTARDEIALLSIDLSNELLEKYGVGAKIRKLELQGITTPNAKVETAFKDVNIAEQDRERLINEGKEEYNKVIPRLEGEAAKLISEAEGYKQKRINEAKGDVARFESVYREYIRNPKLTRDRIYIETMEEIIQSREETTLIDKNLENFLPLKDLSRGGNNE